MSLCIEKRGQITNQTYLTPERVELTFDMPLAEIVFDFYDRLKQYPKDMLLSITLRSECANQNW